MLIVVAVKIDKCGGLGGVEFWMFGHDGDSDDNVL